VDQQKVIGPDVVEVVARDFDLGGATVAGAMAIPSVAGSEKADLVETLRSLANLADRLREEEKDFPRERKL